MIEPYYETKLGKLYYGDCLDILPELEQVDLVIGDPPYGMNFQSNRRTEKHSKIIGDDTLPVELIKMAMGKANMASYFFCRWDNLGQMPKPKSVLVWIKNNWSMGDLKHEHGRQWEAICFYPAANHEFKKRIPDILRNERTGKVYHPTQKPVGLIGQLISANICDSILDPFLGSGTTAIACERLNRKWIGIEIAEEYCEIAAKRIDRLQTQENRIDNENIKKEGIYPYL